MLLFFIIIFVLRFILHLNKVSNVAFKINYFNKYNTMRDG